jgi:RecA-family ATPase
VNRVIRLADFLAESSGEPTFMVEGIIHSTATMLYGGPKTGKSWLTVDLAAALLTGQEQWLGRKVSPGPHVVAFATTDPGSDRETADRLAARGLSEYPAYLVPFDRAAARDQGMPYYDHLADALIEEGVTVLIFDNIFSAIAGDTKEQKDASVLLDGLNCFIRRGIAVIAVHHTGKGSADSPARTPTGSQAFTAWARSLVRVEVVPGTTRRRLYAAAAGCRARPGPPAP